MNRAVLTGNIASDPEMRTTQSGISRCGFRLAVQRNIPDQNGNRQADFLNIVCWRQSADFVQKYLGKGDRIAVEGSIQSRTYDAQDGSKRTIVEINAERVEALTARRTEEPHAVEREPARTEERPYQSRMEFAEVPDDDLPY